MEQNIGKGVGGGYENDPLFIKLQSLKNKKCRIILGDGDKPVGVLNQMTIGVNNKPYIVLDMGDKRIKAQYNLNWDNILDVEEARSTWESTV